MFEVKVLKLFAWVIGVLVLLWLLAECLGGADEADPGYQELDRDADQLAADCDRAWEALELVGTADAQNVEDVIDQIDALAAQIEDTELSAAAAEYSRRTQELVYGAEDLDAERSAYQDSAAVDLAMTCPLG